MNFNSIVYSLIKISQLLEEPALIEDATGIANLITPELIAGDQKFDVMTWSSRTNSGDFETLSGDE
jgi:hypothetical protein